MPSEDWELVTKGKKQLRLIRKREEYHQRKLSEEQASLTRSGGYTRSGAHSAQFVKPPATPQNPQSAKGKKPKAPKKPKVPKGKMSDTQKLNDAVRLITEKKFDDILLNCKATYTGSDVLWVKGIVMYLNETLAFDLDPNCDIQDTNYPSNLLPSRVKEKYVTLLEAFSPAKIAYIYQTLLVDMTTDMSQNLPIVGYKITLQTIAQSRPAVCTESMAQNAMLRNYYENNSQIVLNILWAVGQGGFIDLNEGVKVWVNLMLPCLEVKTCSKFIVDYMRMIHKHAKNQTLSLSQNDFFSTFKALRSPYPNLPKGLTASLSTSADKLLQKYIECSSQHASIFLTLFRGLASGTTSGIELSGCLSCINHDCAGCFDAWKFNYKKYHRCSLRLLEAIEKFSKTSTSDLIKTPVFYDFIANAEKCNLEMKAEKTLCESVIRHDSRTAKTTTTV